MKIIDIIKITINSSENLSKEKRDECIEYINNLHNKINKDIELIEKLKEKNEIYKSTIKGQHRRIEELKQAKKVSKQIQKERNKRLSSESCLALLLMKIKKRRSFLPQPLSTFHSANLQKQCPSSIFWNLFASKILTWRQYAISRV